MMNRAEQNPVLSRTRTGQVKRGLRRWFFGVAMLFGIVLVGCSQGSYPLDIFYEQHYQQSYRSHEPPRLIGVADAVAFYPPTTSTVTNTGADLFRVNCQMCHGSDAKGIVHRVEIGSGIPAPWAVFSHAALRQAFERE